MIHDRPITVDIRNIVLLTPFLVKCFKLNPIAYNVL